MDTQELDRDQHRKLKTLLEMGFTLEAGHDATAALTNAGWNIDRAISDLTSQADKHFYDNASLQQDGAAFLKGDGGGSGPASSQLPIAVFPSASPHSQDETVVSTPLVVSTSTPSTLASTHQEFQDRLLAEQLSRADYGEWAFPDSHQKETNRSSLNDHDSQDIYLSVQGEDGYDNSGSRGGGGFFSDWSLARTLQAMEFEIETETLEERQRYAEEEGIERDFTQKEYGASGWRKQLLTISTLICIAQIAILITMSEWNGLAPMKENPMYGPWATTMVRFGAKDAGLILIKKQWWRLISPIFLHAGVIHLVSNVLIQLRVGGYLNLVFGTPRWMWIYMVSGVFGNMCSCIFLPDAVGVGSSGALMGMLTAWIVWIVFRWKKIPAQCRTQRNCQLFMVLASVAITLGMSFSEYVDWGAHFGGALQGFLWGCILLCRELDNVLHRKIMFVFCLMATTGLFIGALYFMNVEMRPSTANFAVYDQNDDWKYRGPPRGGGG